MLHSLDLDKSITAVESRQGPLAQSVEQRTFNPWVVGSIPTGPTNAPKHRFGTLFMGGVMKRDLWLIGIFVAAVSFASKTFLDTTTYPKLIALTSLLIGLMIFRVLKKKDNGIFPALLVWNLIFLLFLSTFGLDQTINILLGHPGRNLGLLSLLIGILTVYYFRSVHIATSLTLLLISSSIISASYLLAKIIQDPPLLLSQFSFPLSDALNQNILSLYISLGVASGGAVLYLKIREIPIHRNPFFILILLSIFSLWRMGDLQSALYLIIATLVILVINLIKNHLIRSLILTIPYFTSPFLFLLLLEKYDWIKERLDTSILERTQIASLTFDYIIQDSIRFHRPDATADLNVQLDSTKALYVDNAHNIFLEFGVSFGWIPMILFLFLVIGIFTLKTIALSNSNLPIVMRIYAISSLLILYFAGFITILHPITILAFGISLASIFSLGNVSISNELKGISGLMGQNPVRQLIDLISPKVPALSKVNRIISIVLLMLPLALTTKDVQQKWQFREIEKKLVSGQIEQSIAIEDLLTLTLEMKDRQYLDYTGRKLARIGECNKLAEVIKTQEKLGITDFPSTLLSQWQVANCPSS